MDYIIEYQVFSYSANNHHRFTNIFLSGLKMYFVERVANLTATRGLEMRGWEDGFMDGDDIPFSLDNFSNKNVSANPWDNIWEWGASQRAYKFANAGYKVNQLY